MFDLENSTIEQGAPVEEADDVYAAETLEVERSAPELGEPEPVEPADEAELPPEFEPDEDDGEGNRPRRRWQRSARLIVPIGVGLYILISALVNRGG